MKSIILFFLLFVTGFILVVNLDKLPLQSLSNLISYSPCDDPIDYTVDTVDPRFNLKREEFLLNIKQAEEIWEAPTGKDLFQENEISRSDSGDEAIESNSKRKKIPRPQERGSSFNHGPQGELSVNLIFDNRQSLTNEIGKLEEQLGSQEEDLDSQVHKFNRQVADFQIIFNELNTQIAYWNGAGGAPLEIYEKLKEKQQELKEEANRLNALAKKLNQSALEYNLDVGKLNQTIKTFNQELQERPEEGIYKAEQNRIEIYFDTNQIELVHTLAHEFGHALGLEHLPNPQAIMYQNTTQVITTSDDDLEALNIICQRRSKFELIQTNIENYIKNFISRLNPGQKS